MLEQIHPSNPIEAIDESYKTLELALRLQRGFRQNLIDKKCFTDRIKISSDVCMSLAGQAYNHRTTYRQLHNLILSSLAALTIAVDRSLDDSFGIKNPFDIQSQIEALRALIYMLRCAWSHDMLHLI
jgi:hypothetical protein